MIVFEKDRSSLLDYIHRQFDTNLSFTSHFHDSFEFIYVYDGEIDITISKNKYKLN